MRPLPPLLPALLVLLGLPAAAQEACGTTTEGTALLEGHPAVRAFYDALALGDPALVDCAVAAGWTNTPAAPGTPPGPDGLRPTVQGLPAVFGEYAFETQDVIEADGKVVVRSLVTARQTGDFLGLPAGGDPVTFQAIDIHEMGPDGLIARSWHVEDWLSFLLARGALPLR